MSVSKRKGLLLFLLLLSLAGCSPYVGQEQPTAVGAGAILQPGQSVGQTFVAREGGLWGIDVFLSPQNQATGDVRWHLRTSPQSSIDLATGAIPVETITAPGFYRFVFSSQTDSLGRAYYLLFDFQGDGTIRVGSAPGDRYMEGAMYQNGSPLDAQMTFRSLYESSGMLLGRLAQVGGWLVILGIAVFLFVLPGLALLLLWQDANVFSWAEKFALASGVSIALYPLLLLWTNLVHLNLGSLYAWLPGLISAALLIWRYRDWRPSAFGASFRRWLRSDVLWPDLAFIVVVALAFFARFWAIRSLDAPMWGDSYQHTVIAQLLVDNNGLFNSWKPYADLQTLTYHFGFHSAVAVFHWLSGIEVPQAILWVGQILNGLAAIALYPLAVRVGGNRWAGVGAVLLAGLLAPMPMYYLNWGRYTQLAGQVILPVAVYLAWSALETRQWRLIILTWIVLSGLALTHYRILIFAVLFFPAFFLLQFRKENARVLFVTTLWLAIGASLLFLPWFIHAFGGKVMLIFSTQLTTPVDAATAWAQEYNAVGDVFSYLPVLLWILLPLSIGWGLWRRERNVVLATLWWSLILLAANPQLLRLPGQGVLTNFAVFIAFYIPVGVLVGGALGWLVSAAQPTRIKWQMPLLFLLVAGIGLWGARQRLNDLQVAQSALVTAPDVRAAAWIRQNTPANARFLVNSFFAYGDTAVVGSDGGWWLPLLAGRQTNLPPLTYISEQGPRPDYQEWINALPLEIKNKSITRPDVIAMLNERGITYVYIGQRQGRVNYGGSDVLQPEQLLASPNFRPIYHQDRVWVFEVVQ